jgi:hypothetical protein
MSIDADSVFRLFDQQPSSSQGESLDDKTIELAEHPVILIGLFTRMVLKGEEISQDIMKFLQAVNRDMLDPEEQLRFNYSLAYNRALQHLAKIDLDDPYHQDILSEKAGEDFLEACNRTILFFTEGEEYEKCAFIKKIQDFVKFSQKKLPL